MKGLRLQDTVLGEMPGGVFDENWQKNHSGCYWRVLSRKGYNEPLKPNDLYPDQDFSGNLTGGVWGVITPNGLYGMLTLHTVREHEDGTISVLPGDGSSNSILVEGVDKDSQKITYHGYIYNGEWREC